MFFSSIRARLSIVVSRLLITFSNTFYPGAQPRILIRRGGGLRMKIFVTSF